MKPRLKLRHEGGRPRFLVVAHGDVAPGYGLRFNGARCVAGLTGAALAEQADCSRGWISEIENEHSSPSPRLARRIARTTGFSLAWLLYAVGRPQPHVE